MKPAGFEWDLEKDTINRQKHNISFGFAQRAFADHKRIIYEDFKHSGQEQRYYCFGKVEGEIITVRFTYRENVIRIIGAGYWRKGRKIYEEENNLYG
jgi:uncharacterized protein